MFGRKKKMPTTPQPQGTIPQPRMSAEDFEMLTEIAHEIKGCFDCGNGDLLLDDATDVYIATRGVPAPVVEIQYADCLVSLAMSVYHYTPEELGEGE